MATCFSRDSRVLRIFQISRHRLCCRHHSSVKRSLEMQISFFFVNFIFALKFLFFANLFLFFASDFLGFVLIVKRPSVCLTDRPNDNKHRKTLPNLMKSICNWNAAARYWNEISQTTTTAATMTSPSLLSSSSLPRPQTNVVYSVAVVFIAWVGVLLCGGVAVCAPNTKCCWFGYSALGLSHSSSCCCFDCGVEYYSLVSVSPTGLTVWLSHSHTDDQRWVSFCRQQSMYCCCCCYFVSYFVFCFGWGWRCWLFCCARMDGWLAGWLECTHNIIMIFVVVVVVRPKWRCLCFRNAVTVLLLLSLLLLLLPLECFESISSKHLA